MPRTKDPEVLEIGARIREFGLRHYASMVSFADAMEMSKENLNQYLNGRVAPGYKLLKRLSEKGCNLHWLLTGKEESEVMRQLQSREMELEKELVEKDKIISKVAEAIPNYKGKK